MFYICDNNLDQIRVKEPYVYTQGDSKQYVFPLEQSKTKSRIYHIIENAMVVSMKPNSMSLCFKDKSKDIELIELLQKNVTETVKKTRYNEYIDGYMKFFSPVMGNILNVEAENPLCYDNYGDKIKLEDINKNSIVRGLLEIKCFFIGKNWFGFKLELLQIMSNKVHSKVLLQPPRAMSSVNASAFYSPLQQSLPASIPPPPPPPPTYLANAEIKCGVPKPTLKDLLSAKLKLKSIIT